LGRLAAVRECCRGRRLAAAESRRPPGSAGEEAVSEVPRSSPVARAGEVRVAVVDGERLVGVVGIERLLAAPAGAAVGELADSPEVVALEADVEA
jgi:hypothetical protein